VKHRLLATIITLALIALPAIAGPSPTTVPSADPGAKPAHREDWPTYMHDNSRSGISDCQLPLPLTPIWIRTAEAPPEPAWPPPAPRDFFHRKDLTPRVVFDRAFHVVSAGGRVVWGSSSDDSVTCVDLATGKKLWRFHTEGPVRLAPTIAGDRVCFGSDDGCIYCLNVATGSLIWKQRVVAEAPFLPGNGRVISLACVRSGALVHEGNMVFAAGLFPEQGVLYGAVDLNTGKIANTAKLRASLQGYMYLQNGRIHSHKGRAKPGAFGSKRKKPADKTAGKTAGKARPKEPLKPNAKYPHAVIASTTHIFRGGDNEVAAFAINGAPEPVWSAKVDGKAYALSIARKRLIVSTDKGLIYCFGASKGGKTIEYEPDLAAPDANPKAAALVKKALESCQRRKGYALVLGASENCALAVELARQSEIKIVIREADRARAAWAKTLLARAGLYGRISVHYGPLEKMPYTDYMFNLVLHGGLMTQKPYRGNREQARRVVAPIRGVALLGATPAEVYRRGALAGAGQWTHFYADPGNTACSGDTRISDDLVMQWFGRPGPEKMVDRHNRTVAPLSINGRMFISGVNWFTGVDAYNGTILWEKDIPDSLRMNGPKTCGNMAASDTHLYVASGRSCLKLNAETGAAEQRFKTPSGQWAYLALVDGILVGSTTSKDALRWPFAVRSWDPGYKPNTFVICSRDIFALDPKTGRKLWTYTPEKGVIPCPAIAIGQGKVFLVESANPASKQPADCHVTLDVLVGKGANLVALDLKSGKKVWRVPLKLEARNALYVCYKDGNVVVSGSLNKDGTTYLLRCHRSDSGAETWRRTFLATKNTRGMHGESVKRPTIVGRTIYLYNSSFILKTGADTPVKLSKSQCGERSASAEHLFWRSGGAMMANAKNGKTRPLSRSSRPGCWINIIPAGGLVLMPEASSGCRCFVPIQGSMAFRPR
jgi:outer membrane protein assembly factor BamB